MHRSITLFLLASALLSLTAPAGATIIYVSGDQTGTWAADTVIVTAEVRVPPGQMLTISPGVEVLFSVYCKLIVDNAATLLAVGTPADSIRFDVLPPDTAWHGIRFLSASNLSRLEYCILKNGQATGSGEDAKGGAIYCSSSIPSSSNPTISNNTISNNSATGDFYSYCYGGGIYCVNSSPTISANTISGNSVASDYYSYGGGIYCVNSSPTISGNIISGNSVTGIYNYGGGIHCYNSSPSISGNIISGNSADNGGGICCSNSSPTISNNSIMGNSASSGGGINCQYHSNPSISGNTLSGNSASSLGGGIYCYIDSNPAISGNTLSGNSSNSDGGGIYCNHSNPIISGNIISGNSAYYGGAIFCVNDCQPTISANTISRNSAVMEGGGICCWYSSPTISANTISGNSATYFGGGISCAYYSNPTISGNTIRGNSAPSTISGNGGGIECFDHSYPAISGNTISGNSTGWRGGGINCGYLSSPIIIGNTISGNSADSGGGIHCSNSSPTLINCILWGNRHAQIYVSSGSPQVTYSDIQGGYTGVGNINAYPAFVDTAQCDYRLQWGSPCIDTGDPNPIYNDPDGSRADMGAWYYDQSMPVRVLLTPYNSPIQIPASGGSFQYAIQATNIESTNLSALIWCNVTLPDSSIYGPVLGPVIIEPGAGQTLSRVRTQTVPAGAPAGLYHYNAYAVAVGDTSTDSFTFVKLGSLDVGRWSLAAGDWTNTGEEFDGETPSLASPHPSSFILHPCSPNPFNPSTVLSYQLPVASHVSLRIYDTAGRLVTELVNGWRETSAHEVTFDGSGLPSGIYFAKLKAGDHSQVQKLILLK